ncbi:hypothetical protein HMPREF1411_01116 [Helicobacter pylori GAM250AFi]|nr:hypothetical protein HMPREF1411_01116 [Helicobacter pylori GAM250AFi]EMH11846.1 hypothetical protein HMPREF1412_01609 [Helicobacter pylori GAM250T]EMH13923.1 hypothetical protein HMPREF1414_01072 [Helicobacter pylori GAM252T]EMH15675.1 hypothetical protein HMPREF1413_00434 [Helicobacter pylori GAM252Bi]EMH45421.1 hypothetical protein HMPREF1438_01609 [Helicobacter pylori HP250AFii]EMH49812.1 hypothetical protein HMPREF1439_00219 [Helicobacter pylori HP250AFiii]EMH50290.1 hypothetical prote
MILLSNKATFLEKLRGVKGFECQVFIKNDLINAKLALKQTLVFKNLFLFRCKAPLNP